MPKRLLVVTLGLFLAMMAAAQAQEPAPQQPATPEKASAGSLPTPAPATPAPMHIPRDAKLFIEPSEFGMALAAALLKKHVPVAAVTDQEKADFFVKTASNATQEKTGERITKLILFGGFAGSGRHFDATVTVTNRDGAIVFAHNSKKENFQSAAENIAKELKKHIEGQ